jgi:hypothetical protein
MVNASTPPLLQLVVAVLVVDAALTPAQATVLPYEECRIAIEVSATLDLSWSARDVRAFRDEASRAWAAAGLDVCWRDAVTGCHEAARTLHVRIAPDVPAAVAGERSALGWIGFARSGPGTFIVLSIRRATELLARAERGARRLGELPDMVRRLLPRALGRALSHELGHFLLARRAHSRDGLMRPAFRPEDLADEGAGQRMRLTHDDMQRLQARCVPGARHR